MVVKGRQCTNKATNWLHQLHPRVQALHINENIESPLQIRWCRNCLWECKQTDQSQIFMSIVAAWINSDSKKVLIGSNEATFSKRRMIDVKDYIEWEIKTKL